MGDHRQGRIARNNETDQLINLSSNVQAALSASGSLQQIGPLNRERVAAAVEDGRCFVLEDQGSNVIGCVFVRPVNGDSYPDNDLDISAFPAPRLFLHWMMLAPEAQGKGFGLQFFRDVMDLLNPQAGSVLLDCWAENDKLRAFYRRAGCQFVAIVPEKNYEIAVFAWVLNGSRDETKNAPVSTT
jgi:RimJ/RimL family protein N-acetyltransferase